MDSGSEGELEEEQQPVDVDADYLEDVPDERSAGRAAARRAWSASSQPAQPPTSSRTEGRGGGTEGVADLALKRRKEQLQRMEWLERSRGLAGRAAALEADLGKLWNPRGDLCTITHELKQQHDGEAEERAEEGRQLLEQARKVKSLITTLRDCIHERGSGNEYIDRLKKCMDSAEFELVACRERQRTRLDELTVEEKSLTRDVAAFLKHFDSWVNVEIPAHQRAGPSEHKACGSYVRDQNTAGGPAEVVAFEYFLSTQGGHTGGWDARDHADFLHLYARYKSNLAKFMENAVRKIVGQDEQAIRAHLKWYEQYLILLEQKRDAIRKWKASRQEDRLNIMAAQHVETAEAAAEHEHKKATIEAAIQEREERIRQLAEWKALKRKEVEDTEKKKAQLLEDQRQRAALAREQQAEKREKIVEYQKQKRAEQEAKRVAQDAASASAAQSRVPLDPVALWERDKLAAARRWERKEQELAVQLERVERQARLLSVIPVPHIDRDFNRLVAPTISEQKRTARTMEQPSGFPREPLLLNAAPRATPAWRSGV